MVPAPSDRSGPPPSPASVAAVELHRAHPCSSCAPNAPRPPDSPRPDRARPSRSSRRRSGRPRSTRRAMPASSSWTARRTSTRPRWWPGSRPTRDLAAVPLLAIAQSDSVDERIELLEAGADDVMARPIDDQELAARVDGLLLRAPRPPCGSPPTVSRRPGVPDRPVHASSASSPRRAASAPRPSPSTPPCGLADRGAASVALLDLDPWWGQVATQLDLAPRATVVELARDLNGGHDLELVAGYALQSSERRLGVHVAIRPDEPRP